MEKKLYIVRHGQTQFNVEGKVQGWADSPLTLMGKMQARAASVWFSQHGIHFDHAYTSDSQRAIDTLQIITQDTPSYMTKALRERSWGKYDGKPFEEIDVHEDFEAHAHEFGAETAEETIVRVYQFLYAMMSQPDHECVLVVTHGVPVSGLFYSLPRAASIPEQHHFHNGCILEYTVRDGNFELTDFWGGNQDG